MDAAVITFPGSNCDRDVAVALERATSRPPHMVWHGDSDLPKVDLIILPGGFSYGDYLRGGAIAAHSPVMREVAARAKAGVPLLGICNGFQVLTECGLLPGTLMRNAGLKFLCKHVHLRVDNAASRFTRGYATGQVLRMPIAHNEGNYQVDSETMARLDGDGRVAFRYCDADGEVSDHTAPNGAMASIAGVMNAAGNVLGMMPHPERVVERAHGGTDGCRLFESILSA